MPKKGKTVSVILPPILVKFIAAKAKQEFKSAGQVIRSLIMDKFLKPEGK